MKRRNIVIIICILVGVCLMGAVAVMAAVLLKRNPLAKGLANLAEEVMVLEEEMGEGFWTDAINQIGSGNVQAEYSVNVGGISGLQNMTIGLDGKTRRDMEQQLFGMDFQASVANAKLAEVSLFGTTDLLYLQVPSVWEGSVVLGTENVSGQWNDSSVRGQLELLTGKDLGIQQKIDARLFERFSVQSFSIADFFKENAEELKALYENMEVIKAEKAQKDGNLTEEQAKSLNNYVLEDENGNEIETVCYLVVLPEKEIGEIFHGVEGDIKLGVFLDAEERIVRICTLPGEVLVTDVGEGEIALNLTGEEATIDRLGLTVSGMGDAKILSASLSGKVETECDLTIEKVGEEKGSYNIEGDCRFRHQKNEVGISLEGNLRGEQVDAGEKISLTVEGLTVKAQDEVICRLSGQAAFEPLTENIMIPTEKEYRIGEMNELETILFLAECTGNLYKNYSGYMRMLQ